MSAVGDARKRLTDDRRPCKGANVNICAGEGCYDEACLTITAAAPDAGTDVEALAYALDLIDKTPRSNTYRRQAELLLASDWLAAHDAALIAAAEARRAAKAWDEALAEASERGFLVAGYLAMVQANPYRTEAAPNA